MDQVITNETWRSNSEFPKKKGPKLHTDAAYCAIYLSILISGRSRKQRSKQRCEMLKIPHTRTSPAGLGAPPGFIQQLVKSGS